MLRKTNVNRASLRRTYDIAPESKTMETSDQKYNRIYFSNEEHDLRSSNTPYNSSNTSNYTSSMSNLSMCSSRNTSNENEHRNKQYLKSSWNESEQQDRYSSTISWNDTENSADSKAPWIKHEQSARFDLKKSQAKNEQYKSDPMKYDYVNKNGQQSMAISKKYWNESKLEQSESMNFHNKGKHCGRFDTTEPSKQNEQHNSEKRPDLQKLFHEHEYQNITKTRWQCEDKTGITITELVPGLIIQGKVADL
jgi:hypothetical protein